MTDRISLRERIENDFSYHMPDDKKKVTHSLMREAAKGLALMYEDSCPPSRELSLALTALEESVMWANAAIARNK